jgi:MFS family permease
LANYIGITVAYWLSFGLTYSKNTQVIWRFPLAFQAIPALVLSFVIWFLPESPRWLVKKGQVEEAKDVLTKIREGAGVGHSVEEVQTEYEEILRVVELETTFSARNSIFAMPFGYKSGKAHFARRTWLAFGIQIMMEWYTLS